MDFCLLGRNIRKYRQMCGLRQEDLLNAAAAGKFSGAVLKIFKMIFEIYYHYRYPLYFCKIMRKEVVNAYDESCNNI